jgi:hypothetical protein
MRKILRALLAAGVAMAAAAGAEAQNTCSAKGVAAGLPFAMKHCAITFYEDQNSLTFWFSEKPLPAETTKTFPYSGYADYSQKDASGNPQNMIGLSLCQGEGKPSLAPASVRSVEIGFSHEKSLELSRKGEWMQYQWVFELPKDSKNFKVEKLSGEVKPGATISGRLVGSVAGGGGKPFSWEIDVAAKLPERTAGSGMGCSGS